MIIGLMNLITYALHPRIVFRFRKKVGYFPNIAMPSSYHEKMLWRKIFDRNPLFITFCDKLKCKKYAMETVCDAKMPKVLWSGIEIDDLAKQYLRAGAILKANHGYNMNVFSFKHSEEREVEARAAAWLVETHGEQDLQWGYFHAEKVLFIEEALVPTQGKLVDLNVRASDGKCLLVSCIVDNKSKSERSGYFNLQGERLKDYDLRTPPDKVLEQDFEVPKCLNKCLEWASKLSVGVDYARYDFMVVDDQPYIGEVTVYPAAGLGSDRTPEEKRANSLLADSWDLLESHFLKTENTGLVEKYRLKLRARLATRFSDTKHLLAKPSCSTNGKQPTH